MGVNQVDLVPQVYKLVKTTGKWAPPLLAAKVVDKRLDGVLLYHAQFGINSILRGFHPGLAKLEAKR